MLKKKLACMVLVAILVAASIPAYAQASGTHWQIATDLSENQNATFTLPSEYPSVYKQKYSNGTVTYYDYKHSRWFKVFVPSENQTIQWTLAGASGKAFNGEICVEVSDEKTITQRSCTKFYRIQSATTKTQELSGGESLILCKLEEA